MTTPAGGDSGQGRIKEYPENYDEMIKKLKQREQGQVEKAFERHDVHSMEQLKQVAENTLTTKEQRKGSEQKPLKDRTVVRDPQDKLVQAERQRLEEDTSRVSQKVLSSLSPQYTKSLEEKHVLKGRVTEGKVEGSAD